MKELSKNMHLILLTGLLLCLLPLSAGADTVVQPADVNRTQDHAPVPPGPMAGAPDGAPDAAFQDRIIQDLESKGVDTTELKAAFEGGDPEKIRSVLDGLKDKLPQPDLNGTPGKDGIPPAHGGPKGRPEGKSAPGTDGTVDRPADAASPSQSPSSGQPESTKTQSPLSPLTILTGIGAAGLAAVCLKRG